MQKIQAQNSHAIVLLNSHITSDWNPGLQNNYLAVLVTTEYNLEQQKHIYTFINCKMNDYQMCHTDYSFSG